MFRIRHRGSRARYRIAVLLLLLVPLCSSPLRSGDTIPSWSVVPSSVRSDLLSLSLWGTGEGFAAGRYLLRLHAGRWEPAAVPWRSDIWSFSVVRPGIAYVATVEPTNISQLYRFDGTAWRTLSHPLANFISSIRLDEQGRGWIGGWGQVAHCDGVRWRMYPPVPHVNHVLGIFGTTDADLQIVTNESGIFALRNGAWVTVLSGDSLHALSAYGEISPFVADGSVLREWNGGRWTEHSSDPRIRAITRCRRAPDGSLYAVGKGGLLLHFLHARWEMIPLPVQCDLYDIAFRADGSVWIAGANGSLLTNGPFTGSTGFPPAAGFRAERLWSSGKGLDGEYGAAFEDVNGDGMPDLYSVSLYNQNLLFMNRTAAGSGRPEFRDETMQRNVPGGEADTTTYSIRDIDQGVGVADLDDDGDREIITTSLVGHNNLFLNTGEGYFRDVSHQARRGMQPNARSNAVAVADVDNDGDLDMFVTNENGSNRLFLNDGAGRFDDVTASSGLATERGAVAASFADVDGDGRSDLAVSFWTDRCRMYRNVSSPDSGVHFEEITDRAGIGGAAYERSNGVAFGDIDNDGDPDLVIVKRRSPNALYRNDGSGRFTDISYRLGTDTLVSYGVCIADLDNDGWLDLFITNVGTNRFYRNNGDGTFTDRTFAYDLQSDGYHTGAAAADVDDDGDLDLYSCAYINGESKLFINLADDSASVRITVTGTRSNRDAVGAIVRLFAEGRGGDRSAVLQYREITSGSGYSSHDPLQVHFGVDRKKRYDVEVIFPATGIRKMIRSVSAGMKLSVVEETGSEAMITRSVRWIRRTAIDPQMRGEGIAAAVILILFSFSLRWGIRRNGWGPRRQMLVHGAAFLLYIFLADRFFYESSLFLRSLSVLLPLLSLLILHLYVERVVMKKNSDADRQRTRDRIARDLHDDIASTLGSAAMYLTVLNGTIRRPTRQQKELMDRTSDAVRSAAEGMTDIVWSVAPRHDLLGDLIARIRLLVTDTMSMHGVRTEVEIGPMEESLSVSDLVRRNLYLIMKEGVNNITKHAGASTVVLRAGVSGEELRIVLTDDGNGFPADPSRRDTVLHGHGLHNMRQRAAEIGAVFTVQQRADSGVELSIALELMRLHH